MIYFKEVFPVLVVLSMFHSDQVMAASLFSGECQAIILNYFGKGTTVRYCTTRFDPNAPETVYWIIGDCHTWADAQKECQRAKGDLASFPYIDDKYYLERFLSPYVVGQGEPTSCYSSSYRQYMNALWIGLSRPNSQTTVWTWKTNDTEDQTDLPFNKYSTYYAGSQIVGDGDCGLLAYTTAYAGYNSNSEKGYRKAACSSNFHAICMKVLE